MYYFFIFVILYLIFYRSAIHNTVTAILLKSLLPLKNSDLRQKIVILIDFIEKRFRKSDSKVHLKWPFGDCLNYFM